MSEEVLEEVDEEISIEDIIEEEDIENEYEKEIDELKLKVIDLENNYLKAYADAQNMIKRANIDADNKILNRLSGVLGGILPALDNFERALKTNSEDENTQNFLKGFEMIYQQLAQALDNEGIKVIETVNHEFDPHLHEAVMQVNDENYGPNIIVEELQKGYTFNNRVLRVALVKVNQ
ncbi:MAG: nucleotide exchange factor GrpE [Bacilli bacterium]